MKMIQRNYSAAALLVILPTSCLQEHIPPFGVGGRYEEGEEQFLRGRGGAMDRAVEPLEFVAPPFC